MRVDYCLNPQKFTLDLVQASIPDLKQLLGQYRVQAAYIFGSVLDNNTTPLSDLDLAIFPPEDLPNLLAYYHYF